MTSEVLNGAVEGLITAIFFGGIFVAILGVMARYRRRRGKPSPMKPVWLRVGIGAGFCVLLQANGFQTFGLATLVISALAVYWSWEKT